MPVAGYSTLAADLDLTENDAVDFDGKSRYLSLGAEFDAWSWAQLRAGYRANLSDSNRNVWSAGIGLSPFGVHLDLAIAGTVMKLVPPCSLVCASRLRVTCLPVSLRWQTLACNKETA